MKKKSFDCVEMKNEIQARMAAELAGLSDEEQRRRIISELDNSDSLVGRKWREMRRRTAMSSPPANQE